MKKQIIGSFLLFSLIFIVFSCKRDEMLAKTFKGKYTAKVTEVHIKELEQATKEAKTELEKGKKELSENIENAKKEIQENIDIEVNGEKVGINSKELKDALGEVGEGLGKIVEGIGEIGKSIGNMGQTITESVVKSATFQLDFQEGGKLSVGSNNKNLNISSKHLIWEVKDGKLHVKDKDAQDEVFIFQLKPKNRNEWELINDKLTLSLSKAE